MPLTPSGESVVLNALYNSAPYVSLHTGDPTVGSNEVAVDTYARQPFVVHSNGQNPTVLSNSAEVTFPTATASWGTITYAAVWNNTDGGVMMAYQPLVAPVAIGIGDIVKFPVDALFFLAD
jgi:hypothetical protein